MTNFKTTLFLMACLSPSIDSQEVPLKVNYVLMNQQYFTETIGFSDTNDTLRFFTTNNNYERIIMSVFKRFHELNDRYPERTETVDERKRNFLTFAKEQDPYFTSLTKRLAPTVRFDFTGISQKQYILEEIAVETIDFSEYSGGGFVDSYAWYDIELKHDVGIYRYPVNNKLRFIGSGSAELRFWSDNYYPTMGMAPMGRYTINITFKFICDNKSIMVESKPFQIDV